MLRGGGRDGAEGRHRAGITWEAPEALRQGGDKVDNFRRERNVFPPLDFHRAAIVVLFAPPRAEASGKAAIGPCPGKEARATPDPSPCPRSLP